MTSDRILRFVDDYYTGKAVEYGATARGVDWKDEASQELRFAQFDYLWRSERRFSLNDIGCGYGATLDYLQSRGFDVQYCGVDVSAAQLDLARARHPDAPNVTWHEGSEAPRKLDYTVASGILNVKGDTPVDEWRAYVFEQIDAMARSCTRGFAFNVLSLHSDPPKRQPNLYYADPGEILNYVGQNISRLVLLAQDCGLYEFTVAVHL
jgi:SAM-dependent methyltransferase